MTIGSSSLTGNGIREVHSQCPFQILLCDDDGIISSATAFLYSHNHQNFLITNWHNVAGRDWTNISSSKRRVPTYLRAKFATYVEGGEPNNVENKKFTALAHHIQIYNESRNSPLWYEHPELGSECDIIALPIERPLSVPPFMHGPANEIDSIRIPVTPGGIVFVVGYPRGISVGFGLPIWKSGFIASEPFYDVTLGGTPALLGGMIGGRRIPAFFIDSLTREGMSGSPIFASYTGTWDMTNPYRPVDPNEPGFLKRDDVAIAHTAHEFVGIYSGRIGADSENAALGLCWRKDNIHQICQARKLGKHPHTD